MTTRAAVQPWVQGTLGCHCDAAVFDRIEVSRGTPGLAEPQLQLIIGQRLLVQLRAIEATEPLEALLPHWITQGVQRRDARQLNRVRLVLCGPASGLPERVQALLEQLPLPDDRVRVHVLPLATLLALESALASGGL